MGWQEGEEEESSRRFKIPPGNPAATTASHEADTSDIVEPCPKTPVKYVDSAKC